MQFRRVRQRIAPLLTLAHEKKRLEWVERLMVQQQERARLGATDDVLVHIDEKWFFSMHVRHVWTAPIAKAPALTAASRTHLVKEMLLAAVARPIPARGFDGAIGLWPVVALKQADRNSKYRKKGELYEVSCTLDTDKFLDMMETLVVRSALEKCGKWARQITFQFDNAGGHGGGRGDINQTTIAKLAAWARELPQYLRDLCEGNSLVFLPPRNHTSGFSSSEGRHPQKIDELTPTDGVNTTFSLFFDTTMSPPCVVVLCDFLSFFHFLGVCVIKGGWWAQSLAL